MTELRSVRLRVYRQAFHKYKMARTARKIGVLHNLGSGNLGDDATLTAVIQNIKTRWPDTAISCFNMNAENIPSRHSAHVYDRWKVGHTPGKTQTANLKDKVKIAVKRCRFLPTVLTHIYAVVIGVPKVCFQEVRFLFRSIRLLHPLDLLVISGGQLVDSPPGPSEFQGGPWKFPYTTFKWVLLARLAGVRTIILNVGAGPLHNSPGKSLVNQTLRLSDYVSFRDEESRVQIRHIGYQGSCYHFPAGAYGLDISTVVSNRGGRHGKAVVGLAPLAHADPRLVRKRNCTAYHAFIRQVGSFAASLINNQYCVTLFCTDIGADPPLIADLETIVKTSANISDGHSNASLCRAHQWSIEELLSNMSSMDYVVASRLHAVVFAHLLNIPVLAISNHPKVTTLMNDLGLSQYCLDVGKCDADMLSDAFLLLLRNREEIKGRMANKLATYQEKLAFQFDRAIPLGIAPKFHRIRDLLWAWRR